MKQLKKILLFIPNWLVYQYNSIWNTRHFKKQCKIADKLHEKTGKRYFVIPGDGRCHVVDNEFVKQYNRKAKKKISFKDLIEGCYYCTSAKSPVRKVS